MTPDDPRTTTVPGAAAAGAAGQASAVGTPSRRDDGGDSGGGRPARSELEVQVRFGDTDSLGHVNNAVYASYAELGRVDLLSRVRWDESGPILARLAIDFHAQLRLGSRVVVTTEVRRIRRSSIELYQEVLADGKRVAAIESIVVWFDYGAQRSVRVPEHVRAVLEGRAEPDPDAASAEPGGTRGRTGPAEP